MLKAHRVYRGVRYCTTCYARVFKRRPCSKCGEPARLPLDQPDAVCRHCEVSKPCVRCGRIHARIGLVTPYGPVCNACAPHFRTPEPCDVCCRMSRRLSRVMRLGGQQRLCPRCARAEYATCPSCRRYRLLIVSPDGRQLCRACAERGHVPCPSCDKPMPAGRGKLCEACYWTETCRKRVDMDTAAFSVAAMRGAFGEFGRWLETEVGAPKAALTIHRYLPFFIEIDACWKRIPAYPQLLEHFSAEGLRRVILPMRWLGETRGIEPDSEAREADSERRRIEALGSKIPAGSRAAKVFAGYRCTLMSKFGAGRTSLRSIRLALRPAVSLLMAADPSGNSLPDQRAIDRYLLSTPGQRAAVTGFVHFLSRNGAPALAVCVDCKKSQRTRRRALEREIMLMAKHPEEGEAFERRWVGAGLEYFHGVRVSRRALQEAFVSRGSEGLRVVVNGGSYFLPWCNPHAHEKGASDGL